MSELRCFLEGVNFRQSIALSPPSFWFPRTKETNSDTKRAHKSFFNAFFNYPATNEHGYYYDRGLLLPFWHYNANDAEANAGVNNARFVLSVLGSVRDKQQICTRFRAIESRLRKKMTGAFRTLIAGFFKDNVSRLNTTIGYIANKPITRILDGFANNRRAAAVFKKMVLNLELLQCDSDTNLLRDCLLAISNNERLEQKCSVFRDLKVNLTKTRNEIADLAVPEAFEVKNSQGVDRNVELKRRIEDSEIRKNTLFGLNRLTTAAMLPKLFSYSRKSALSTEAHFVRDLREVLAFEVFLMALEGVYYRAEDVVLNLEDSTVEQADAMEKLEKLNTLFEDLKSDIFELRNDITSVAVANRARFEGYFLQALRKDATGLPTKFVDTSYVTARETTRVAVAVVQVFALPEGMSRATTKMVREQLNLCYFPRVTQFQIFATMFQDDPSFTSEYKRKRKQHVEFDEGDDESEESKVRRVSSIIKDKFARFVRIINKNFQFETNTFRGAIPSFSRQGNSLGDISSDQRVFQNHIAHISYNSCENMRYVLAYKEGIEARANKKLAGRLNAGDTALASIPIEIARQATRNNLIRQLAAGKGKIEFLQKYAKYISAADRLKLESELKLGGADLGEFYFKAHEGGIKADCYQRSILYNVRRSGQKLEGEANTTNCGQTNEFRGPTYDASRLLVSRRGVATLKDRQRRRRR